MRPERIGLIAGLGLLLIGATLLPLAQAAAAGPPATQLAQLAPLSNPTLTPTIKDIPPPKVQDKQVAPAVVPDPPEGAKVCPKPGTLDCMPKVNQPGAPACAYWRWVQEHCPGVQVVW
jgi:hypothetical protein